jgi:hypothetical protein
MKFYKGVLVTDLVSDYVPGSVTRRFNEALMWKERIESKKSKGAARHSRKGKACVIEIDFDESLLLSHEEFQRTGVSEHKRQNCWMSADHQKAQINTPVSYHILTTNEINNLVTP